MSGQQVCKTDLSLIDQISNEAVSEEQAAAASCSSIHCGLKLSRRSGIQHRCRELVRRQLCSRSVSSSRTCSACWTSSASCLEQVERHKVVDSLFLALQIMISSFIDHAMYCSTILYTKYYMAVCPAACRQACRQKNHHKTCLLALERQGVVINQLFSVADPWRYFTRGLAVSR